MRAINEEENVLSIRIPVIFCLASFIVVSTMSFGSLSFVPSIVPPHQRGFFVEFTALGYSAGLLNCRLSQYWIYSGFLI